jgi:hypothetical protein
LISFALLASPKASAWNIGSQRLATMVRLQGAVGAVLGLSAFVYAVPQQATPSANTRSSATTSATQTNTAIPACALAANEQAAYLSAHPTGKPAVVFGA